MEAGNSNHHAHPPLSQRLLSFADGETYSPLFLAYFKFVKRGRFCIVAFWIALTIWGSCTGMRYIHSARDEMSAPKGTRAYDANLIMRDEFLEQATSAPLLLYIACANASDTTCTVACPASTCAKGGGKCKGANAEVARFSAAASKEILAFSKEHEVEYKDEVLGFYNLVNTTLDQVKCKFASPDGRATFVLFEGSMLVDAARRYSLVEHVNAFVTLNNPNVTRYRIGVTGTDPIMRDGSVAAVEQSEVIDAVTMPFAFMLLAYMVRSWRLLLISLMNMAIAMASTFGVLAVVSQAIGQVPMTTTSSFVEVLGLAMSVDYSLFLLRRFRDERMNDRSADMAVKVMLSQSGHVVMLSGATIVAVFGAFVFMKSAELRTQGIACVVVIMFCMLVNMTNGPAMLLIFPNFFGTFHRAKPGSRRGIQPALVAICAAISRAFAACARICTRRSPPLTDAEAEDGFYSLLPGAVDSQTTRNAGANGYNGALMSSGLDEVADVERHSATARLADARSRMIASPASTTAGAIRIRGGPYRGWYFRLLLLITRWPYNLMTLVSLYVCVIPLALQFADIARNQNLLQAIPRGSEAGQIYREMLSFSGGIVVPMFVLVEGLQEKDNSILTLENGPAFFKQMAELTHELSEATGLPLAGYTSVALAEGKKVSYLEAMTLLDRRSVLCVLSRALCDVYALGWRQSVNARNTSALISIAVDFDPFAGDRIETFIDQTYEVLDEFNKREPVQGLYLTGQQIGMVADMRTSFDEFPLLVAATCLLVFTLLGAMLKSVFVVVRLTLTVMMPLASVFGLTVLVFQRGILNWTGFEQLQSNEEGLFWYIPLLSFTVCLGLALDYDVLVISRIREHRVNGLEIRAAILRAMWEINSTVVCAGLIMSLAFGGLMISDTPAVNQLSFILTTSVLFDTFIIQTIVVPCIMSFADHISWWPGKVPTENLITLEEEVENRNNVFAEAEAHVRAEEAAIVEAERVAEAEAAAESRSPL